MDPIDYIMPARVIKEFLSDSGEETFQIREGKDGRIYCTCWPWRKSPKDNKDCKHLRMIRNVLDNEEDRSEFTRRFSS